MDNQPPGLLQQHLLPVPDREVKVVPVAITTVPKHFLAAFFLSFFLGVFGADRFYLGYYVQGVLKLLTFGWLGIGAIIDLGIIMGGGMRDAKGNALAGYDDYKSLAKKTILWITIGGVALVLVTGVITVIEVEQAINKFQSSGASNILGGSSRSSGSSGSSGVDSSQVQSLLDQLQ